MLSHLKNFRQHLLLALTVGTFLSQSFSAPKPLLDFSRGAFGILNAGNQENLSRIPEAYFDYLKRMDMQWVAIAVTLHVQNSVDSTVERFYSQDYANFVPTFPDSSIINMTRQLHTRGYKVLINLSLDEPWPEDGSANPNLPPGSKPAWRYQIGDPITPTGYTLAQWPWNPSSTIHTAFITSFWNSYTRETLHYADICQQEGIEVLQVGAETQELFRTRPISTRTNHFRTQIKALVDSTRVHYQGQIAYYMHAGTWAKAWHNADTLYHELWGDAGFDIIGGSVYNLVTPKTTIGLNTLAYFKGQYKTILSTYFGPVFRKYPTKTVAVLELGLPTWDKTSIGAEPDGAALMNREDLNSNKIVDAEEVQANMFEAYYFMADSLGYPEPGFLFGDEASSDATAHLGSAYWGYGVRNRQAELTLMRRFRSLSFTQGENTPPRMISRSDSNYVVTVGQDLTTKNFLAVDDDTTKGDLVLYRSQWTNFPWFGAATSRGNVSGSPMDDDAGWWQAKVYAQDVYGQVSVDTAKFILWAIHPRSPEVTSVPPTTMTPGTAVNYQTKVVDANGVAITTGLTYSLLVNPFFLSVNSTGKVTGMPTFAVAGTTRAAEVKIVKTTVPTATYYDSWEIKVLNVNDPPTWGGDGSLLSPTNNGLYSSFTPIPFKVGYSNDLNDDTLLYIFHIFGPGFDTSFVHKSGVISRNGAQKWDTTELGFGLDLNGRLGAGQTYTWIVKVTDRKDTLTSANAIFRISNGVPIDENKEKLLPFSLGQSFLQPGNRTMVIPISLPQSGPVSLTLYDMQGRSTGLLMDEYVNAGRYLMSFEADRFIGQVLFYELEAGKNRAVRKMLLMR